MHVGTPSRMLAMGKPQYYDLVRKQKENKTMLRDFAKENQILSGHFISEDLLIRSNKEIVKSILPFLKYLLPVTTDQAV